MHVLLQCNTPSLLICRKGNPGICPYLSRRVMSTGTERKPHWPGRVSGLPPTIRVFLNAPHLLSPRLKKMIPKSRFSTKYNENQITLINYLKSQLHNGRCFLKSKYIAKELGLSSKEVGTNMAILSEICPEFTIERYSYSNSTTWLVTPGNTQGFQRKMDYPVASV